MGIGGWMCGRPRARGGGIAVGDLSATMVNLTWYSHP